MRRPLALGLVALVLSTTACGHADSAELPDQRTQVRTTAAELIPKLAATLGGTAGDAAGHYEESGGDLSAVTFRYTAGSTIHVEASPPYTDAIEKALKDLGYDTRTSSTPNGATSTSGQKDGLDILVSSGGPVGEHDVSVSLATTYVKVPKDEVKDYQAKVADEPLTLK